LTLAVSSARLAADLWKRRLAAEYDVVPVALESRWSETGSVLPNATATKANLRAVLDILAGRTTAIDGGTRALIDPAVRLDKATPDDIVVVYIASHGFVDLQGRFYVIPFDTGNYVGVSESSLLRCERNPGAGCAAEHEFLAHAISSDDLAVWWDGVDAGDMILTLDSCHSAAAPGRDFRPGPLGDRGFGQLSYDKGMRILAAAQPDKLATATYLGRLGHTLLTESLRSASRPGQTQTEWLRLASEQLSSRAAELYAGLREDQLQLPELMDFRTRSVLSFGAR
jgi:hypothetical protein